MRFKRGCCYIAFPPRFFFFLQFNKISMYVCLEEWGREFFCWCYKQWMPLDVRYTAKCVCEFISIDSVISCNPYDVNVEYFFSSFLDLNRLLLFSLFIARALAPSFVSTLRVIGLSIDTVAFIQCELFCVN